MEIEVRPSGQACGAEVRGVDLSSALSAQTASALRSAWLEHKVLAFPEQSLTDDDLVSFALAFGPLGDDPYFHPIDENPNVAAVHRRADETTPLFADAWHADWSFQAEPPDGTCLYGMTIPPHGGDTLFANQAAAWRSLPAEFQTQIEGLAAVHSARVSYAPDGIYGEEDAARDRAMRITFDDAAYETQLHPLVAPHRETGEMTLYSTIGYIMDIEGMAHEDALVLLKRLWHYQTDEAVQYRHAWEPNMLVLWDNRCVLHRATGGYDGFERLLHRTTIGYNATV